MFSKLWYKLPFTGEAKPQVALIHLAGMIAPDSRSQSSLNLEGIEDALKKAFELDAAKAVVVSINSPGGSPAQSRMIHDRIRVLAEENKKPVITYIEDLGASGGYMLALSGDEIFADPFAIVGSIGVISAGFGLQDAIARLGIERRVHAAGKSKSQLDPFKPENPEDVERFKGLLAKSHDLFIAMVTDRRGGRIKGEHDEIFNGAFWIAGEALELGLIDKVGDMRAMIKARFGDDTQFRRIATEKKGMLTRLLGFDQRPNFDVEHLLDAVERRTAWMRFGQ